LYGKNAISIVEGVDVLVFETLAIFSAHRLLKIFITEGRTEKNCFFSANLGNMYAALRYLFGILKVVKKATCYGGA